MSDTPAPTMPPQPLAPASVATELAPPPDAVARIRAEISLGDRAKISTFGDKAQREVTAFADRILAQARAGDLGETGRLLGQIILKAKQLDPAQLEKEGLFKRLFGGAKAQVEKFRLRFEDVAGQIDTVGLELEKRREDLRRDIAMLDELHSETRASILQLEAHIAAGKAFVAQFREGELPALKARAEAGGGDGEGLMAAQAYQDAVQALDRLEKRILYLQQARQIGVQQLPQIRIVQASDETLMEQLLASTRLTIPLWKQKMVLVLGLNRQREALGLQNAVNDATNAMLRETSEMMKGQAIEIEAASQRGLVDLETLEKTNADLIDTITGVLAAQEDGRAKRAEVEARLDALSHDLRRALADSSFER